MDDALLMRRFQGFGDLLRNRQGLVDRNRTLRDAVGEGWSPTSSITSAMVPSALSSP